MGSSNWAGREKRTAAMSATPMNLRGACQSSLTRPKAEERLDFFKMPRKVLSLPESSWARSPSAELLEAGAEGVEVPEAWTSEPVAEGAGDSPLDDEGMLCICSVRVRGDEK